VELVVREESRTEVDPWLLVNIRRLPPAAPLQFAIKARKPSGPLDPTLILPITAPSSDTSAADATPHEPHRVPGNATEADQRRMRRTGTTCPHLDEWIMQRQSDEDAASMTGPVVKV